MKNNMKKIIVAALALVFLFTGSQSVFASSPFNGQSGDCNPGVGIGNYSKNNIPRNNNGCWTSTYISADSGDTVNIAMYYHNNTNNTLTNVRGSIIKSSSGPANTFTFTGRMYSDQGDQNIGTATLSLSSSQTLTYSSTHIMKTASDVLADRDTSVVYNDDGQISIGNVPQGWNDYGEILVVFKVGDTVVQNNNCSISSFNSNTNYITSGDTATLSWNTSNCTNVTISNLGYNVPTSGTQAVWPTYTTTYTLTATGSNGQTQTRDITVNVNQNQPNYNYCSISNFTVNGSSYSTTVSSDNQIIVAWSTYGCSSATISGPGVNSYSLNGSQYIYPQNSGTYTISAYGNNSGTQTKSIYLNVNSTNYNYNYNNNTPSLSINTPTNITTNSATLNGYVNGNGSTVNSWIEFPCYGNKYDNRYSQSYSSLSAYVSSLSPNTTYTYCVAAQNNNQIYRSNSVTFTTLGYNSNTIVYTNNNIVTTVATNVANNSATINGYITNPNYYNTNVYFEYGTSVDLGSRTTARNPNGVSAFNENLTGLSSDTIYFFRAVSEGPNGNLKGTIEIFRTLGATVVRPIIVQGATVIGSQSPIMLKIENRYPSIGEGDIIDYTITYKNIGKTTLTKPMLQVIAPKGITLTNSTAGTYSSDTNTLTVPLEDLTAGKEGSVNLQGKVVSVPTDAAQIVSTAVLVYTNKSGAQENAMAYVLNTPKTITANSNNMLGAAAFFGGIFPTSLVGWLILTILIMLLVMIARTFYRRQPAHAEATH
jgi:hypothetical protein